MVESHHDFGDANISTERSGFSTRPFVTVMPGAPFQFLFLSPVDLTDNVLDGQVAVSAGNLSNLGNVPLLTQLADQFNNSISSNNYPVNFSVINVIGSTGTVRRYNGSIYNPIGSFTTDANGQVGADGTFFYFVSTKSADSAEVQFYNGGVTGNTLPLVTRGGTPSKLVFINPPASSSRRDVDRQPVHDRAPRRLRQLDLRIGHQCFVAARNRSKRHPHERWDDVLLHQPD